MSLAAQRNITTCRRCGSKKLTRGWPVGTGLTECTIYCNDCKDKYTVFLPRARTRSIMTAILEEAKYND